MDNRLLFFGCSFTQLEDSLTNIKFENYRFKISKNTNLNQLNYSQSGNSNPHIIDSVYNCSNETNNLNNIFVIQYSFFDRLGMRADILNDEFVSMCKKGNPDDWNDKVQINLYNHWLKYFYSKTGAIIEFEKNTNLISSWLKSKQIKFVSFGFDLDMDSFSDEFYVNNNFIKFDDTYSMYKKSINDKLRIFDLGVGVNYNDYHLNEEGHNYLSGTIESKLKELKYIK